MSGRGCGPLALDSHKRVTGPRCQPLTSGTCGAAPFSLLPLGTSGDMGRERTLHGQGTDWDTKRAVPTTPQEGRKATARDNTPLGHKHKSTNKTNRTYEPGPGLETPEINDMSLPTGISTHDTVHRPR